MRCFSTKGKSDDTPTFAKAGCRPEKEIHNILGEHGLNLI